MDKNDTKPVIRISGTLIPANLSITLINSDDIKGGIVNVSTFQDLENLDILYKATHLKPGSMIYVEDEQSYVSYVGSAEDNNIEKSYIHVNASSGILDLQIRDVKELSDNLIEQLESSENLLALMQQLLSQDASTIAKNIQDIEEEILAILNGQSSLNVKIASLEDNDASIIGVIDDIKNSIDNIQLDLETTQKIDNLTSKLDGYDNSFQEIERSISRHDTSLNSLYMLVSSITESDLDLDLLNLSEQVSVNTTNIRNYIISNDFSIERIENVIDALEAKDADHSSLIEDSSSKIRILSEKVESLEEMREELNSLDALTNSNKASIVSVNSHLSNIDSSIQDLLTAISSMDGNAGEEVLSLASQVNQNTSKIDSYIQSNDSIVETLTNELEAVKQENNLQGNSISSLQASIASLLTQVGKNTNSIDNATLWIDNASQSIEDAILSANEAKAKSQENETKIQDNKDSINTLAEEIDILTDKVNNITVNEASESIKSDLTVTVGYNGDFETLSDAIEYISDKSVKYKKDGIKIYIEILPETVIEESLSFKDIDLSFVTIVNDFLLPEYAKLTQINENHYILVDIQDEVFIKLDNAKSPNIGCIFKSINTDKTGIELTSLSEVNILPMSGFVSFLHNIIAKESSKVNSLEGYFVDGDFLLKDLSKININNLTYQNSYSDLNILNVSNGGMISAYGLTERLKSNIQTNTLTENGIIFSENIPIEAINATLDKNSVTFGDTASISIELNPNDTHEKDLKLVYDRSMISIDDDYIIYPLRNEDLTIDIEITSKSRNDVKKTISIDIVSKESQEIVNNVSEFYNSNTDTTDGSLTNESNLITYELSPSEETSEETVESTTENEIGQYLNSFHEIDNGETVLTITYDDLTYEYQQQTSEELSVGTKRRTKKTASKMTYAASNKAGWYNTVTKIELLKDLLNKAKSEGNLLENGKKNEFKFELFLNDKVKVVMKVVIKAFDFIENSYFTYIGTTMPSKSNLETIGTPNTSEVSLMKPLTVEVHPNDEYVWFAFPKEWLLEIDIVNTVTGIKQDFTDETGEISNRFGKTEVVNGIEYLFVHSENKLSETYTYKITKKKL